MVTPIVQDTPAGDPLTDRDLAVLDLAAEQYRYPGMREQQMYRRFGFGETRYFQILDRLLDQPSAMHARPQLVARLRRLRDRRTLGRRTFRGLP